MMPSNEDISHLKWLEARGIINIYRDVFLGICTEFNMLSSADYFSPLKVIIWECYDETDEQEFACIASLAHHTDLTFDLEAITLCNISLDSVPAEHLASLFRSVMEKGQIMFDNVSGWDLVTVDSIKCCKELCIMHQNLTREEAQAIERARMRCEKVMVLGCTYVSDEDDEPSSDEDEEAEPIIRFRYSL